MEKEKLFRKLIDGGFNQNYGDRALLFSFEKEICNTDAYRIKLAIYKGLNTEQFVLVVNEIIIFLNNNLLLEKSIDEIEKMFVGFEEDGYSPVFI